MKKAVVALMILAFAVAAQAGGASCCADKDKAACSDKDKAACAAKEKGSEAKSTAVKKPLPSPKAADQTR